MSPGTVSHGSDHEWEIKEMRGSMAEFLKAEGRKEGRKEGRTEGEVHALRRTLVRLLQQRFGEIPGETLATIKATSDLGRLEAWIGRVISAETLAEIGIQRAETDQE